eukprot:jgi/Botrbrau1/2335/Bobra.39_1s0024.1
MEEVIEGRDYSFPAEEEQILEFWESIDAFQQQLKRSEGKKPYVFYDGPPFATGLPHYGHLLAGTLKDIVTRYASATGHHCPRRFGWDCHGLPVEYEIDKRLNIQSREDVLAMGIDKYNEECRSIVMRYAAEWEVTVKRIGRWIDFQNDYKTLDPSFMESVWWVFSQLYKKGLVYKGFKVMPYSTACCTPLSNFEAGQNYKDVSDPAIMVAFPIIGDPDSASLVAWTTTPWTLPSNLALCVNPDFTYVRVRDPASGKTFIVAESRLSELPGAVPKAKKGKKGDEAEKGFEVLESLKGSTLAGKRYEPLFPYFAKLAAGEGDTKGAFRVVADGYVTSDSGTGVVHCAPAFGEDDMRVCLANGIVDLGGELPCPVDPNGNFNPEVTDFAGLYVKDADKEIVKALKGKGRLVDAASLVHSYPFCWRSDTPLIYKAVASWFVKVEAIKEKLLANNAQTYWVPTYVKEKRFHNWLENAHDWAVSRTRFWGTPLPIWTSEDGKEIVVVGSIEELERLTGEKAQVTDLHRHFIDHLTIPSPSGGAPLRRVDDVFDCWFESGSMPYGQLHYPFENADFFEGNFPADFVAEGLDQTRGWFYTLMVLSTALFDKPAFKNLVCNGLVLASDGKKMSKRLKNYPDPVEILKKYGADALRLYLINSPVVRAEPLRFREDGVFAVVKDVFLPWYNAYRFLVQNILRLEAESGTRFVPSQVEVSQATNVLDRWINAASRSLTAFVRKEMGAYRLYTVVPYLVRFIDSLTNVYVRYNRARLKGRSGTEDCQYALASLFDVLLTVAKVMAPFTPFFCEKMYSNLRRALPEGSPESVHWCDFPDAAAEQEGDAHIQQSVERMQAVIELGRAIRDRKAKPIKLPLRELVVVHTDAEFLQDIIGELRVYVQEELNVREVTTCSDPLQYASVRAQPDFSSLGRRLGKAMPAVAKAVAALTPQQIADYEATGSITLEGQTLGEGDLKVLRDFRLPEGRSPEDMDADGDGEVLAVLDLRPDISLVEAGVAREVVNRVQKLRKKAGLVASDAVEVFLDLPHEGVEGTPQDGLARLSQIVAAQVDYIAGVLGIQPRLLAHMQGHAVVIAREKQSVTLGSSVVEFDAVLARPSVFIREAALLEVVEGNKDHFAGAVAWLASRDPAKLGQDVKGTSGVLRVRLDGRDLDLRHNHHFDLPSGAAVAKGAALGDVNLANGNA